MQHHLRRISKKLKKMNEEEDIFKHKKGPLYIHHIFLLHELYHDIMSTFKFKGEKKKYPNPTPEILSKLKKIVNKCSNIALIALPSVSKKTKKQNGPSFEILEGGGKQKGGALVASLAAYVVAHAKIAAYRWYMHL